MRYNAIVSRQRKKAGISPAELAAKIGVSLQMMRNIETDFDARPSLEITERIIEALALEGDTALKLRAFYVALPPSFTDKLMLQLCEFGLDYEEMQSELFKVKKRWMTIQSMIERELPTLEVVYG